MEFPFPYERTKPFLTKHFDAEGIERRRNCVYATQRGARTPQEKRKVDDNAMKRDCNEKSRAVTANAIARSPLMAEVSRRLLIATDCALARIPTDEIACRGSYNYVTN